MAALRSSMGAPRLIALLAGLVVLVAADQAMALPPGFQASPALTGLSQPTSVRFAPGGAPVFVAEKRGVVRAFDSLADPTPTTVVDLRTDTHNFWDRGMLGLAVDPGWPARPYIYVLYTRDADVGGVAPKYGTANTDGDGCADPTGAGCIVSGRLARVQLDPATDQAVAVAPLVDGWCQQFPSHSIGDLRFGPDGMLYASAGDGASFNYADYGQTGNPCADPIDEGGALRAQDIRTTGDPLGYSGAVIRVSPDGGAPAIVADGLRNPFRFAVRPGTNELWVGDVGWNTWEELDRIAAPSAAAALNFGWPCYEGAGRQGAYDGLNKPLCENLYASGDSAWARPHWTYNHGAGVDQCPAGGSAVSGVAFASAGGDYPAGYRGGAFVSDYSRDCIWYLPRGGDGLPDPAGVSTFLHGGAHPVELELAPDGNLLYADLDGGSIVRITYNRPTAVATASPTSGPAPLTVQLDGTGSTGTGLSYAWDLDGDGQFDDATGVRPMHTFPRGTYTVRLQVTDASGVSALSVPLTISSGNTAPTAQIVAPTVATAWSANETVGFAGTGNDPEDGTLPASRLTWSIVLHHCPSDCHDHPLQTISGAQGGFTAPDHAFPSYLTLTLTVTDSGGLTDSQTVRIDPRTAQLVLDTEPAGRQVVLDDEAGPAPLGRTVIRGSSNLVSAVTPQSELVFAGWSDGGAATHSVTVLDDTRLVARFGGPSDAASGVAPAAPAGEVAGVGVRARVQLVHRRRPVIASARGIVRLRVHCPSPTPCAGTIVVRAAAGGPALGSARFTVRAMHTMTVRLRLTAAARRRLARHGLLRAIAVLRLVPTRGSARRIDTVFTLRPATT
jgi:glucose/arabinose dehydrogenase